MTENVKEVILYIFAMFGIPAIIAIAIVIMATITTNQRHERNMECLSIGGEFTRYESLSWTCTLSTNTQ